MQKRSSPQPGSRASSGNQAIEQFLPLAIGLTTALGQVHGRGLIHKDIKPANVLVNACDWPGVADGFRHRFAPAARAPGAGTSRVHRRNARLHGSRANRADESLDRFAQRSLRARGDALRDADRQLPFTASDPMEWVHCHIARQPMPPCERLKDVPGPVSAIIMKLLARRLRSAIRPRPAWKRSSALPRGMGNASGRIDEFPLGEHDTPDRLLIPEKLYGREREIETLARVRSIASSTSGTPELVLVSGYSGIGKSSVVNELHKALVPPRGLFASGKFDQYKRDIPYATLAQAFQSLIRRLLGKSEAELSDLARLRCCEALGPNGRLMIDLVPELKLIIGEQPPVPELAAARRATTFPAGVPAVHRRVRAAGASAGAVPRRLAMARRGDARSARGSADAAGACRI